MVRINLATEFTDAPGVRSRKLSDFSGQQFREDFLEPLFKTPSDETIEIDFTDVLGYPPSFLEESFGGMARILNSPKTEWPKKNWDDLSNQAKVIVENNSSRSKEELQRIKIVSDDPILHEDIATYIENGDNW